MSIAPPGQDAPLTPAGLTDSEATERLRKEGFNALPRDGRRTLPRILADVLREPMLALLLGAGGVYMALGDLKEALVLVAFAIKLSIRQQHLDTSDSTRPLRSQIRP